MNVKKLKQEGKKWIKEGIITDDQLEEILAGYAKNNSNVIILLFAVLLTSLAIITFIFSDWAQVPHFSRTLLILILLVSLYVLGDRLYQKSTQLLGVSFIVLGYIVFGVGLLLTIDVYTITVHSAWPFLIWGVVGLFLYFTYNHTLLFAVSILVTTIGQIYSVTSFASFNWVILALLLVGFAYFVYRRSSLLFAYLFSLSFVVQMLVLVLSESYQYYWLIIYFFGLYIAGDVVRKDVLKTPLQHVGLFSIFLLVLYESFLLQESYFIKEITHSHLFLVIWFGFISFAALLKARERQQSEWIDLILFLPVFYLPYSYMIGLITMFLFSIGSLLNGYRKEDNERVIIGITAFLISTFTVYIQYAWEAMNKSLFFFIGGMLLFVISFTLEKRRQSMLELNKGGERK